MARAGLFRELLTLERETVTGRGAAGTPETRWDLVGTLYGDVATLTGKELEVARQTDARTTVGIDARYEPDVYPRPADRLLLGDRVLHVYAAWVVRERGEVVRVLAGERP